MRMKYIPKTLAITMGVALASSVEHDANANAIADASVSPFLITTLSAGYMLAEGGEENGVNQDIEGNCGNADDAEVNCGGDKNSEGSCGVDSEGTCGGEKGSEGAYDGDKDSEGKCGEGRCGG